MWLLPYRYTLPISIQSRVEQTTTKWIEALELDTVAPVPASTPTLIPTPFLHIRALQRQQQSSQPWLLNGVIWPSTRAGRVRKAQKKGVTMRDAEDRRTVREERMQRRTEGEGCKQIRTLRQTANGSTTHQQLTSFNWAMDVDMSAGLALPHLTISSLFCLTTLPSLTPIQANNSWPHPSWVHRCRTQQPRPCTCPLCTCEYCFCWPHPHYIMWIKMSDSAVLNLVL